MSVVCMNDLGAFLDYLPLTSYCAVPNKRDESKDVAPISQCSVLALSDGWSSSYSGQGVPDNGTMKACYRWKRELFAVDSPFMMNSQAERLKREALILDSGEVIKETSAQRKRRKKSQREVVLCGLEQKISTVVSKALPGLIEQARKLKCLQEIPLCPSENNQTARDASLIAGCGNLFANLCCAVEDDRLTDCSRSSGVIFDDGGEKTDPLVEDRLTDCCTSFDVIVGNDGVKKTDLSRSSNVIVLNEERGLSYNAWSIIGRPVCNSDDMVKAIQVDSHQFLIPPRSSFLTSSFHRFVAEGYKQIQVKIQQNATKCHMWNPTNNIPPSWKSLHTDCITNEGHSTQNSQLTVLHQAVAECLFPDPRSVSYRSGYLAKCNVLVGVRSGYELIVLDPPWNNKSVKRKKSYHTVDERNFEEIPINELAGSGGLICVWVTNNERLKEFVTDELFPHWSVDFVAEWIWLKVTRTGEAVCDILSAHKKPYEQLIIGRFTRQPKCLNADPCCVGGVASSDIQHDKSADHRSCVNHTTDNKLPDIPPDFLLASVPCLLHSKKPSLAGILSQYLPSHPRCLELFARNLTPGWVSWGFEPLLHQHVDYFEQIP